MKKIRKILLVVMMITIVALTGCQSDLVKADLVGKYECESINGKAPESSVLCYLEIVDEETYTLVYSGHGYDFDFPGTYNVKGNKLFLDGFYDGKGNPAEQECVVDGNAIKYTELQTDYEYVFTK